MYGRIPLLVSALALAALTVMATPPTTVAKHSSGIELVGPLDLTPQALPPALAHAFGDAWMLARQQPADFGLPWVDREAGVLILRTVTPAGDAFARAWTQRPTELRSGAKVATLARPSVATSLRPERRSFGAISYVLQDAIGPAVMDLPDAQLIFSTEPDFAHNRAIVTIDHLSDPLLFALAARFGTEVLAVRVEPRPDIRLAVGRDADNPPFWGGAKISAPNGSCTDAFPWISGSQSYMLTAGHCAPDGGSVSTPAAAMGYVTATSGENWQPGTGTVALVPDATQPGALRGDMALVTVTNGSSGFQIYRGPAGSSSSSAILGKGGSSVPGDSVCSGGAYSGEQCAFTVSRTGVSVSYNGGMGVARYLVEASRSYAPCIQGGDSGGPVFTTNPDTRVSAKGIIDSFAGTGGTVNGQPDPCMTYYTDIWDAYWGFPGDIKTN